MRHETPLTQDQSNEGPEEGRVGPEEGRTRKKRTSGGPVVKLFILGLPGSGKSEIARYLINYVSSERVDKQSDQLCSASRFNDYAILDDMFRQDTKGRFKPTAPGGFDVLDLSVFDEALQILEQEVNSYISSGVIENDGKELIVIEFSRNDYSRAFEQFNQSFLRDAYFLYLDTELETCKQRVRNKILNPKYEDDYPVSEYIFENYYSKDNWLQTMDDLTKDLGIDRRHVSTFNNNLPEEVVLGKYAKFENREPIRGKDWIMF